MPKRVLDGEGLWRSDKLAHVEPKWIRAEYANLLPLSLANGVFELESRRVWSLVYSYNRPDITIEDVDQILAEFDRVGMLFRWNDAGTGKAWGFLVGIDRKGRLPSPSRLDKKHEAVGPNPPEKELKKYIESRAGSQWLANGQHGFGFGFGFGTGSESRAGRHAPKKQKAAPSAPGVCDQIVSIWNSERGKLPEVLKLTEPRRRKILSRISGDSDFHKTFAAAVQKAAHTPFLCGDGKRGWRASFDWMIENDTNAVSVIEGKYDDKGGLNDAEEFHRRNLLAAGHQVH
jgi:hypothetical protein